MKYLAQVHTASKWQSRERLWCGLSACSNSLPQEARLGPLRFTIPGLSMFCLGHLVSGPGEVWEIGVFESDQEIPESL